jgi:integrase
VPGEPFATDDEVIAAKLAHDLWLELREERRRRVVDGMVAQPASLGPFASELLAQKAASGSVVEGTLESYEVHFRRAAEYFGADRLLESITLPEVNAWVAHLRQTTSRRGRPLSAKAVQDHVRSLSMLFRAAAKAGRLDASHNPAALADLPKRPKRKRAFLEVHEVAAVLEAAQQVGPYPPAQPFDAWYELIAALALTGGRRQDVLGLHVEDVDFDRETVTFWARDGEGRKTEGSNRVVPLWPQLAGILRAYLDRKGYISGPLFRGVPIHGGKPNLRDGLNRVAELADFAESRVRCYPMRHSYCAARLQTLDHGEPIALYTVAEELGHGSEKMVREVYAHLGKIRHRAPVVEYVTRPHEPTDPEVLRDQIRAAN